MADHWAGIVDSRNVHPSSGAASVTSHCPIGVTGFILAPWEMTDGQRRKEAHREVATGRPSAQKLTVRSFVRGDRANPDVQRLSPARVGPSMALVSMCACCLGRKGAQMGGDRG